MDNLARRRQQLLRQLREEDVEAFLITHPVNVSYLTGFTGESSYLVVGRKRALLVSDGRFTRQIQEECPGLEAVIRPPDHTLQQAVGKVLDQLAYRRVGFESWHLTVGEWEALRELSPAVTWKGGSGRVERLRAIKEPGEIVEIREAIAIAERAFAMFRAMLQPADREKDLADALEMYVRRAGGRCTSFPSIVAAGARSALPHAPPTSKTVGEAGFLLVDWGASGRLYKSDLTRVLVTRTIFPFPRRTQHRRADAKLEQVYEVVRRAQERALQAIRPGVQASAVDAAARSLIAEEGYGDYFLHGLGHGLGLQVHEAPAVRANSTDVLQPGMVITIEPGIYLPDWGGVRLEDDVMVTPDGCEVLSSLRKDYPAAILEF